LLHEMLLYSYHLCIFFFEWDRNEIPILDLVFSLAIKSFIIWHNITTTDNCFIYFHSVFIAAFNTDIPPNEWPTVPSNEIHVF
jgi:hypothetical protein